MFKNVAFIPVRGGSKSIPLKNIKPLNGKPLVYWAIQAAKRSQLIDQVYVSTDSDLIAREVKDIINEKTQLIERSAESATDQASTESAMLEFAKKENFETIVLLQATSPLVTSNDLDLALQKYYSMKADSLVSVVRQKRFVWEQMGDYVIPRNYDPLLRPRRQDFEGFLVENGAIYITSRQRLLSTQSRISGNIIPYTMHEETYFELDEPSDWVVVENLLKARNGLKPYNNVKNIKMFVTDCDGVLTDGGMYYSPNGEVLKKFNTKDGKGFELLQNKGIKVAIISGENSDIVRARANKLGVSEIYLGVKDKLAKLDHIVRKYNLKYEEIAYIGDDVNDLEILEHVGLKFSVADAIDPVKKLADYVTKAKGGEGAVREAADYILEYL